MEVRTLEQSLRPTQPHTTHPFFLPLLPCLLQVKSVREARKKLGLPAQARGEYSLERLIHPGERGTLLAAPCWWR